MIFGTCFASNIDIHQMRVLLSNKIEFYNYAESVKLWKNIPLNTKFALGDQGEYVSYLKYHLLVDGELPQNLNDNSNVFNNQIESALLEYQKNNQLSPTGKLNNETIKHLNTPIAFSIRNMQSNLNRLNKYNFGGNYVLVNIPIYNVDLVYNDTIISSFGAIVGKRATPRCVLDSKISSIVFNPRWYVPTSIAKKEMMSNLDNPAYFKKRNFHVFSGDDEVDLDDLSSGGYGNLKFVQYPGVKNALGKIKFVFPNSCGIYLHDTNQHNLFSKDIKGLSHGCIRLSNPQLLANYLFKINGLDVNLIDKYWNQDATKTIYLKDKVDVHIIYLNAFVDRNNTLITAPDIYEIN